MISFDVSSLFTNIPLNETIDIAIELLMVNEPNIKFNRKELKTLFQFATSKSHFLFEGETYDQIDGVAMGSPLAPVLANIFMGHYEKIWIENYKGNKVEFYKRYVDDIFCLFKNENDAINFFDFINIQHPNISFTYEKQIDGKLCFLDVMIKNTNTNKFQTSIFRKTTFTGLLTNYLSFVPSIYKISLVKTLINRVFCINNSWKTFDSDLTKLKDILAKNMFPPRIVNKIINEYLIKKFTKVTTAEKEENKNISYFKLPYLGAHSEFVSKKIRQLGKHFCNNLDIKISFSMVKVGDMFSLKSDVPKSLRSGVVYFFKCASCNSSYVGETSRYFETRVHEHLNKSSQPTAIFQHLQKNQNCKTKCNESCFKIIDRARTKFTLEVKEAIHTQWLKPNITKQKNLFLTISV